MSRFQPLIDSLNKECEIIQELLELKLTLLWEKHKRLGECHYNNTDDQLADFRQAGDIAKDIQDYRRELYDKRTEMRALYMKD